MRTARRAGETVPVALRERFVEIAGRILANEGEGNLTMRRVAAEAGCSTMMLYTLFGGKEGLVSQVHGECFRLLAHTLTEDKPKVDPLARILQLGHAYRTFALQHPTLYLAVFSRSAEASDVPVGARRQASPSFAPLVDAVRRAAEAGLLDEAIPSVMQAELLWAVVHGYVSLELTGYFAGEEALAKRQFELLLRACTDGFRAAPKSPRGVAATSKRRRR